MQLFKPLSVFPGCVSEHLLVLLWAMQKHSLWFWFSTWKHIHCCVWRPHTEMGPVTLSASICALRQSPLHWIIVCVISRVWKNDSVWLLRLGHRHYGLYPGLLDHLLQGKPATMFQGESSSSMEKPTWKRIKPTCLWPSLTCQSGEWAALEVDLSTPVMTGESSKIPKLNHTLETLSIPGGLPGRRSGAASERDHGSLSWEQDPERCTACPRKHGLNQEGVQC